MSLPKAYNRHLMETMGARAVWEPGSARPLGAIVVRRQAGLFAQVGDLAEHQIAFNQSTSQKTKLNLASSGTQQRIIQADATVEPGQLKPDLAAELELSFSSEFEFLLNTNDLSGSKITNLEAVAAKAAKTPDWDFERFCIVTEVYVATSFSFLGTKSKSSDVSFSGTGSAILSFLNFGLTFGLTKAGKSSVEFIGQGGPIAMVIARVKKNGDPTFDI